MCEQLAIHFMMPEAPYSFMVEVSYLLSEDEVLKESRATLASFETVLIFHWTTNIGGEKAIRVIDLVTRHVVS